MGLVNDIREDFPSTVSMFDIDELSDFQELNRTFVKLLEQLPPEQLERMGETGVLIQVLREQIKELDAAIELMR